MSGRFTRRMYDGCAFEQNVKQSTDPLELVLDVTKYVHCNNICQPARQYPPNSMLLVDVESSLWGLDKLASSCDQAKYPYCGPNGCLLNDDPRIPPNLDPLACSWKHIDDRGRAVIATNMKMPTNPGYKIPNTNVCTAQGNGWYIDHNKPPVGMPPSTGYRTANAVTCHRPRPRPEVSHQAELVVNPPGIELTQQPEVGTSHEDFYPYRRWMNEPLIVNPNVGASYENFRPYPYRGYVPNPYPITNPYLGYPANTVYPVNRVRPVRPYQRF